MGFGVQCPTYSSGQNAEVVGGFSSLAVAQVECVVLGSFPSMNAEQPTGMLIWVILSMWPELSPSVLISPALFGDGMMMMKAGPRGSRTKV